MIKNRGFKLIFMKFLNNQLISSKENFLLLKDTKPLRRKSFNLVKSHEQICHFMILYLVTSLTYPDVAIMMIIMMITAMMAPMMIFIFMLSHNFLRLILTAARWNCSVPAFKKVFQIYKCLWIIVDYCLALFILVTSFFCHLVTLVAWFSLWCVRFVYFNNFRLACLALQN